MTRHIMRVTSRSEVNLEAGAEEIRSMGWKGVIWWIVVRPFVVRHARIFGFHTYIEEYFLMSITLSTLN